jgi:hypothetical protein
MGRYPIDGDGSRFDERKVLGLERDVVGFHANVLRVRALVAVEIRIDLVTFVQRPVNAGAHRVDHAGTLGADARGAYPDADFVGFGLGHRQFTKEQFVEAAVAVDRDRLHDRFGLCCHRHVVPGRRVSP